MRKSTGGSGWADFWMRDHFGWEYKGKPKDLRAAYNQLLQYKDDLENAPLLSRMSDGPGGVLENALGVQAFDDTWLPPCIVRLASAFSQSRRVD